MKKFEVDAGQFMDPVIETITGTGNSVEKSTQGTGSGERTLTVERKSHKIQIYLRPSVYRGIKQMSEEYGTSVNDLMNRIFKVALQLRAEDPEGYFCKIKGAGL